MGAAARSSSMFQVLTQSNEGEDYHYFDIVFDCSGCFEKRVNFGRGGLPAIGERTLPSKNCTHKIATRGSNDSSVVAVFGSGYSAATSVRNLISSTSVSKVYWLTRKSKSSNLFEVIENDPLPSRKSLCELGNKLSDTHEGSKCSVIGNVAARKVEIIEDEKCRIHLEPLLDDSSVNGNNNTIPPFIDVDKIHNNCGLRPDTSIHSELQVHYCYASDGPMKLAASLGGGGDCLAQTSKGVETLLNPEPNFFICGIKSYGRNSSYLLKMGIAQSEEIAQHLAAKKII